MDKQSLRSSPDSHRGAGLKYNPESIESKWQKVWQENHLNVVDMSRAKRPFYNLMMFPYPSAEGLHVGNMYAFTAADIYGRFKRHQGFDVFEPIGLDGFGIHSENYALKVGRHPKEHAAMTEKNFYSQLHKIGCMYDWTRTVETYNPNYYKWTQWIFTQMFKKNLAYRGKALVNFCPKDKTVLSDEQVINGKCERCGTEVEKKETEQWFFKITAYADRLLSNLDKLDWTEKIKTTQKNWIGKSEGAKIRFKIQDTRFKDRCVDVFTTRPDTLFGAAFLVLSPEHELVRDIAQGKDVMNYLSRKLIHEEESHFRGEEKTGVDSGCKAVNPISGEEIPIWISDYVLAGTGTGAIMGVPAHDQRDFEFAKKFGLPIVEVVSSTGRPQGTLKTSCQDYGILLNSGKYSGMKSEDAIEKIVADLGSEAIKTSTYHLRDWLVSRQRYWGAPIPMIDCPRCGWQAVPEPDLPVLLPDISDYQPEGTGKGPLANHPEFYRTKCPKCRGEATRETDVCDTFLDSAWYELRYPSVRAKDAAAVPFNREITKKWLPVDMYTGGAEHAVLHLMYFRFVTMVLADLGFLDFEEPTKSFFAHGLLISEGAKMSKSKGNVVNPDEYIARFGADALRLYLMFMGPVDLGGDFRDSGMAGMRRWVEKAWRIVGGNLENPAKSGDLEVEAAVNRLVVKAGRDIEARHYNTVIAAMMEFLNLVGDRTRLTASQIERFLIIFSVFAPHMAEELWQRLCVAGSVISAAGPVNSTTLKPLARDARVLSKPWRSRARSHSLAFKEFVSLPPANSTSIHQQLWPEIRGVVGEQMITIAVSVNGKTRSTLTFSGHEAKSLKQEQIELAAKSDEKVARCLLGKEIKRVVYVPGRIVNFVV